MGMIDITDKEATQREAIVEGVVLTRPGVIKLIRNKSLPKGDVLEAAKIAGILAAKRTHEIVPLCHPIAIEFLNMEFFLKGDRIRIRTIAKAKAKTGVEMEAFVATAVSCLTIYDMCKAQDRDMIISDIKLLKKAGGKSGEYERK
jgi:cyclic pyranopterin phosphate synthase